MKGRSAVFECLPGLVELARMLRREQTDAEDLVWQLVRRRRLAGFKFRRQHPVGRYVLDFFCFEARLAIELDGEVHRTAQQSERDSMRTKEIECAGIRVLRFWNHEVLENPGAVLHRILIHISEQPG